MSTDLENAIPELKCSGKMVDVCAAIVMDKILITVIVLFVIVCYVFFFFFAKKLTNMSISSCLAQSWCALVTETEDTLLLKGFSWICFDVCYSWESSHTRSWYWKSLGNNKWHQKPDQLLQSTAISLLYASLPIRTLHSVIIFFILSKVFTVFL